MSGFGVVFNLVNLVVVQIAQVSEKTTFLRNLNDLKEPSSKSRAQKYL